MQLNPYLNFKGQCETAFKFYENAWAAKSKPWSRTRARLPRSQRHGGAGWKIRLGRRSGHFLVCGSQGGHGRLSDDPACLDIPQSISGPWPTSRSTT